MAYGIVSTQSTTGSSVILGDVSGASATAANQQVSLKWTDPDDVSVSGNVLAHWDRTIVVRKAGSAPSTYTDGTIVVSSTVKNQYSSTAFVDTGLSNGTTYYYRFFPVSKEGSYKASTSVSAKPSAQSLTIPTITGTYTYSGIEQSPTISNFDATKMIKTGDLSKTNAGTYSITVALTDEKYIWSDGTFAPKVLSWTINKQNASVTLSKATAKLTNKIRSTQISVSQVGDGALTVSSNPENIVNGVIDNGKLIISRIGDNVGTTTVTITAATTTNYNTASAQIAVSTADYTIMTVTINEANSNPETCCTYADDAIGMEPGSDLWDKWFGHYPVLFKDGAEVVKIDPNNFHQDITGKEIDITSGDAGDIMIAFPRRGLRMSKSGNIVTISMTDNPDDPDFEYMAHKRGSTVKDKFYIGAYESSLVNNKLRSLSGKTLMFGYVDPGPFRIAAQANGQPDGAGGSGYDIISYYPLTYLIAMYTLKYKNLNSQEVIGNGVCNRPLDRSISPYPHNGINTGGTETMGMDYGSTADEITPMKLFGIENLCGNTLCWIDGFWSDNNKKIWTATENFNNNAENYTLTKDCSDYPNQTAGNCSIIGDTYGGFICSKNTERTSGTMYYCDMTFFEPTRYLTHGGSASHVREVGIYTMFVHFGSSGVTTNMANMISSRLMYL